MMTSLQDYKFCEPKPPATAIDGEIIPTADIDNRHPTLRFEDWYYLKEMIHFLRGDMVFWNTLPNHSEWLGVDVDWNYLLEGCTPFYDPGRRDRYVYLKPDFPLVGLDSGVTQVQVSPTQLIKQNNWMSSISDLSQVIDNVSLHKQLDANDLRRIYWELNNTRNWYIRHSLDGVYEYHQTYRVGQGESGTTYQVDEWDQIGTDEPFIKDSYRCRIGVDGLLPEIQSYILNEEQTVIHNWNQILQDFAKYDYDTRKWQYCQRVVANYGNLYGQVDFTNAPIQGGFVGVKYKFEYTTSHNASTQMAYRTVLAPLERIGTTQKWRFKWMDSTVVFNTASELGVNIQETQWGDDSQSLAVQISPVYEFWGKTELDYWTLPDEWQYLPS